MRRLVFLLEERSMEVFLEGLLPRLFPELTFMCVRFEGKQDLERSLRDVLRRWRVPGDRFIVMRDNDGDDCLSLKERLEALCSERPRADWLVRIPCQELEAWYLAEPDALADAFRNESLRGIGSRTRFRRPDQVRHPSRALEGLVPGFQKTSGARLMSCHVTRLRNRSPSFRAMLEGIERLAATPAPSTTPTTEPLP